MEAKYDYSLAEMRFGAQTAVQICMAVRGGEKVLILGDRKSHMLSQAIHDAAIAAGAHVEWRELEDLVERPVLVVPDALRTLVTEFQPDVSFYTAGGQPGELRFRQEYRPLVMKANPKGARHAHMINVTNQLMTQGMRVDYERIYDVTMWVYNLVKDARRIRVTNPKGTDLTATLSTDRAWVPCHGLYHDPGQWGNLPEGEVYTSPIDCNGVIAADVLGDYFSEKYGVLDSPVVFEIDSSYITNVFCENKQIEADVKEYVQGAEFADRVGEFAIGTNVALTGLVGNLLQDEKLPGVHVAFGDPYASMTGADWTSPHHMDVIPTFCTVYVDGRCIMRDGEFTSDVLREIQEAAQAHRPVAPVSPGEDASAEENQ